MQCPNCGHNTRLSKGLVDKSETEECERCGERLERKRRSDILEK